MSGSTALYAPYRAIGYVTDGVPFIVNHLGDEIFLLFSIGKSFQVFKADHLNSCLVSQQLPDSISAIEAIGHETYAGVGKSIYVFYRTKIVRQYNEHDDDIIGFVVVGKILLSYSADNVIKIIDTKAREVISTIELMQESTLRCVIHPATYLNKFLLGFENGHIELWNMRRKALIHSFQSHISYFLSSRDDGGVPAVLCMEQSPACDVVAIGFSSGDILLMNIKQDKVLFSFRQQSSESDSSRGSSSAVTSISFRTDGAAEKFPYMVSGSADGRVFVWHLGCPDKQDEPRRLMLTIDDAHAARVSRVHFLHGEPIMITAGEDNSVKTWIFDAPDGSARLLRSREGHRGTSNRVRFYGGSTTVSMRENADAMSCEMLSAGSDGTFRLFNFALESQNREMTQKPILKKLGLQRRNERLPEIIGFDCCETRQYEWSDVATIHKNHSNTYLWRFRNRTVTEVILKQPSWKSNSMLQSVVELDRARHSTAVCLTACGNYCVVGSRGGSIYLYNAQSGLPRGSYPVSACDPMLKKGAERDRSRVAGNVLHETKKLLGSSDSYRAGSLSTPVEKSAGESTTVSSAIVAAPVVTGHTSEVTGVFVDLTNSTLVSCGLDGLVIFWGFNSRSVVHSLQLSSPQTRMQGFLEGDFVCTVGQDRIIRVFDVATMKLCRRFDGNSGHSRAISDVSFTPDGRRLLSASLDSTVRVWDMPTSRCLSWMKFDAPVTSICTSLSGEYLCATLADKEGIHMYIDRSLYETVHFWKEPTEPTIVGECVVVADDPRENSSSNEEEGEIITAVQAHVDLAEGSSRDTRETTAQRGEGAITLAALPKAYWITLFNLEEIKQRNKPTAAPTAPPQAPFFLPTVVKPDSGTAPSFPTPQEYSKLTSGGKALEAKATDITNTGSDKKNSEEDPFDDVSALAGMSSAWDDDDEETGDGEEVGGWEIDTAPTNNVNVAVNGDSKKRKAEDVDASKSKSRILRKNVELPRCHLVAVIDREFPHGATDKYLIDEEESAITEYLKSIAPPAVDAQLRALCTGHEDARGVDLIHCLLLWFAKQFRSGKDFEVLQAYLYRLLLIYSDTIIRVPDLNNAVSSVKDIHADSCKKFRHLIQSNLCVLKMMAQISSV